MSSVWNLLNPIRNGATGLKLLSSGRELFGTVIQHGKMDKTVTVKVDYRYWYPKTKEFKSKTSKYQVHDSENFCVTGDKVVIKSMLPISTMKHYYVRNIVKPFPRDTYYKEGQEKKEMSEQLKKEYQRLYQEFYEREQQRTEIKNKKDEVTLKSALKAKALTRAMANLRKVESTQKKKDKVRSKSESRREQKSLSEAIDSKLSKEI
ncbi:30S ribosomal protein S17 (macronuclear) [Tetrahymena thermophila SB210]|uniref:30S ribosomal protein S17 n=1 Tax=Tetrahymena thermophila (strain SB210) TaxID=312017 RepID=I7M6C7_TETTS|nr:30S ribosomal protein S17 [Tetrahymena thermophila SB210]EAR84967.1 30S ribosomal protein S17 [Tetrahymena thermophila SB210]|eukprot:XP_001032630.1 30S ribosomal protein S17 [Tetrahymena thermophila SB210]